MGLVGGRQCLTCSEPLAHLVHSSLASSSVVRLPQSTCPHLLPARASLLQQMQVTATASTLERSAQAETSHIRSTVIELAESIRSGQRSAAEVTEQYLSRIEGVDPQLRCYLALNREKALSAARSIDSKIAAGHTESLGPLAGVPISIKDNILTQGIETTAASSILSGACASSRRCSKGTSSSERPHASLMSMAWQALSCVGNMSSASPYLTIH